MEVKECPKFIFQESSVPIEVDLQEAKHGCHCQSRTTRRLLWERHSPLKLHCKVDKLGTNVDPFMSHHAGSQMSQSMPASANQACGHMLMKLVRSGAQGE